MATTVTLKKRCRRCDKTKPVAEFHLDRDSSDGLQSYCKTCQTEYRREYRSTIRYLHEQRLD